MKTINNKEIREKKKKKAFGLIDNAINKIPIELHIPTYQYAGPGTKLRERLGRGDPGKNELDAACKNHDIAYETCGDSKSRIEADKTLITNAFKRIYAQDAKLDERLAALLVSVLMGAKVGLTKMGLGLSGRNKHKKLKSHVHRNKSKRNRKLTRKSITFSKLVRDTRENIKKSKSKSSPSSLGETITAAIRSAKDMKRGKTVKIPRVLKLPKFGGSIQAILPILSGLSAVGSITASAAGVVKAIKEIQNAKKQLMDVKQHPDQRNLSNEKKIGRALNLIYIDDKSTRGSGFYLKPYQQQN